MVYGLGVPRVAPPRTCEATLSKAYYCHRDKSLMSALRCSDGKVFSIWHCVIPRLFQNYDFVLTKMLCVKYQAILSCRSAAAAAEVEVYSLRELARTTAKEACKAS